MMTQSSASPIGNKFLFKTRYVERAFTIDPGLSSASSYVFRLNSLYDPNLTSTGHQPIGFDQIMPLYDHYCVIGARVRVTATNMVSTIAQDVVLHLKDTNVTSDQVDTIIENGNCVWKTLAPAGSGGDSKTLTLSCSPNKFFGSNVMQDDKYKGTISTNPDDGVFLHITGQAQDGADNGLIRLAVVIEYVAVLTEPKLLTES
jgi:hypothetical protein